MDILPDLVGYLLVLKAFSKASYVYDYASDLCIAAKKMCIISGVKLFTIVMISSFDVTMSLLLSFCFAITEIVFGIPFFIKLFTTITYLAPIENKEAHDREGRAKRSAIIALVVRLVLAMLPDLTALSLDNAFTYDTDFTYLRFRPLFILFSVFISIIVNTIWLVKIIRYFKKAVTSVVVEKCNVDFLNRTRSNTSLLSSKNSLRAIMLTIVGSLFIFDFTWEYTSVDIFEDFMFPLLATLGLLFLAIKGIYKLDKMFLMLCGCLALHVGANIFEMSVNIEYFEKFNVESVLSASKAEMLYVSVSWSALLSSIMLIASTFVILLILKRNARQSIVEHAPLFSEIDIDYYLKEFDKRTKKNIITAVAVSSGYAFLKTLSVVIAPYTQWMTVLNIALEVIYIVVFISAALYIHDEVYKRIMTFS